ncbi:MAG: pyridoxamine 5'-phosphate oxidase [Gammaproteobacteria bacterium]|nr:pyridoxamine 5'-phosphate oxidase [Gammaproteobacteria bacterium]
MLADRLPDELPGDPMHWADAWIKEATSANVQKNPNALTLATVSATGQPSARVVLCKHFVPDPGYFVVYTNYESRKTRELLGNANVCAVFHWDSLGRQIRIEGKAVLAPESESDAYFASREWGSQLGAWGSDQSRPIESRAALLAQIRERGELLGLEFGDGTGTLNSDDIPEIPRPPHWGGIRIWARSIELWINGVDRIHDRALWQREIVQASDHGFSVAPWTGTRLQP